MLVTRYFTNCYNFFGWIDFFINYLGVLFCFQKKVGTFLSFPLNLCQKSHRQHFEETTLTYMSIKTTRSLKNLILLLRSNKNWCSPSLSCFWWNRPDKLETKKLRIALFSWNSFFSLRFAANPAKPALHLEEAA
jgi:hypothetical protein